MRLDGQPYMAGEHLVADALTKSLSRERFWYLISLLGLSPSQPQGSGGGNQDARPAPETLRRAMIAVLCLASVVPGATQGPDEEGTGVEDGRVWTFWIVIVAVIVFAWVGVKLSIRGLQRQTGYRSKSVLPKC